MTDAPITHILVESTDAAGYGQDLTDFSYMKTMTCRNHRGAVYLTKGPGRSLFLSQSDPDVVRAARPHLADRADADLTFYPDECACPASDLVVVVIVQSGIVHLADDPFERDSAMLAAICDTNLLVRDGHAVTTDPYEVTCFMCQQAAGIDPDAEPGDPASPVKIDRRAAHCLHLGVFATDGGPEDTVYCGACDTRIPNRCL